MINQLTAKPMVILNRSLRPQTDLISAKSGYVLKNVPAEVCVTSLQGCIFQVCLLGLFFFFFGSCISDFKKTHENSWRELSSTFRFFGSAWLCYTTEELPTLILLLGLICSTEEKSISKEMQSPLKQMALVPLCLYPAEWASSPVPREDKGLTKHRGKHEEKILKER